MPAHADDEGNAEIRLVGVVEFVEAGEFTLAEPVKPDARLLIR